MEMAALKAKVNLKKNNLYCFDTSKLMDGS